MSIQYLSGEQLRRIHHHLMLDLGQSAPLIAPDKLDAAAHRPATEAFGVELFPTLAEKAAALLQALAIAHAFLDGNKRLAAAATITFLRTNGLAAHADQDAFYDLVIAVTTGELREVEEIAPKLAALFGIE